MSEEEFTRYDEKELFEELSKNKDRRSNILINLNVSLQRTCSFVANIKDVRELQEYKIAVVSVESELQKSQQENKQLKQQLQQRDEVINKVKAQINHIMQYFDESTQADLILLLIILDNKGE